MSEYLIAAGWIVLLTVLNVALIVSHATSILWVPVQAVVTVTALGFMLRAARS